MKYYGGSGGRSPPEKNSNPQIICYDPRLHDPTFEGGGYLKTIFPESDFEEGGVSLRGGILSVTA